MTGRKCRRSSPLGSKPALPLPVRRDGSTGRSTSAICWSIADADSNMASSCREVRFCMAPARRNCCGPAASRTFPGDPGRSDVEVFLDALWTLVLCEEAARTLQGLIDSTKALIESTAQDLLDLWKWRRDHPASLSQPLAQWQKGCSTESTHSMTPPARSGRRLTDAAMNQARTVNLALCSCISVQSWTSVRARSG